MLLKKLAITLEMIKWEHSVFALPFALAGAMLAARGWPGMRQLVFIILCMITARTAAMSFNRWADAALDADNPRTMNRAIPTGALSPAFVGTFACVASLFFLLCAAQLNRLTLWLSPGVLAILLGYSYTKRFTSLSHVVLGLGLGLAPTLAWIAVRGSLDPRILALTGGVLLWVGGFDVLYACQDERHDRQVGLKSLPASMGTVGAFRTARLMHITMLGLLLWTIHLFGLGFISYLGLALVTVLITYEHLIVSPTDLRRMNAAFFLTNGMISVVFFASVAADLLLHR